MLAFVFPGQGSQKPGMGHEIADRFPEARETFEQADEALGYSISQLCFDGPAEKLQLTANSQPAILTTSIATLRAIERLTGLRPGLTAGHSLGEYSALVCAGALAFEDAVRIVHQRGKFMQQAVPEGVGSMAAVTGAPAELVEQICREATRGDDDLVTPANYNAPIQTVIAGHTSAVERAADLAEEHSAVVKMLRVSAPFHCPLMRPAGEALREVLAAVDWTEPRIPVISNVEAEPHPSSDRIAELLVKQVTSPVRWAASVQKMVSMGVEQMVEIGPGRALRGLIRRIDKSLKTSNVQKAAELEDLALRATDDLAGFVDPARRATKPSAATDAFAELEIDTSGWAEREDGARVSPDGTHIVWPDGMQWRFDDVDAHGF